MSAHQSGTARVNRGNRFLALLAAILFWAHAPGYAQPTEVQQGGTMLRGVVGRAVMLDDDLQAELGMKCRSHDGSDVTVERVLPESQAYHVGVREGDRLLDARVDANLVELKIERAGRVFSCQIGRVTQMPPVAPSLTGMIPRLDAAAVKPFDLQASQFNNLLQQRADVPLTAVVTVQQLKLLASYNIELIVDRSNSMRRPDCPGGLSRWQWCGEQSSDLARALMPYVPDGLTITTFASDHEVFPHSSPQKIVSIFDQPNFQLGTRLCEALTDRLTDYFAHRHPGGKPLLIAVITDGMPTPFPEPLLVRDELVKVTKWMNDPREVTVAFLQIGGRDFRGQAYLQDLDANLVGYGAKYDIVHTKMFESLQRTGLGQALVDTVQESLSFSKPKLDPVQLPAMRGNRNMRRMGGLFP